MPQPLLLDSTKYVDDLTKHIASATKRVYIMSLVFTDDNTTHHLVNALQAATHRGVTVNIAADAFTFGEFGGYFSPLKRRHKRSRHAITTGNTLIAAGAQFIWLGDSLRLNPFSGVTHSKWAVVDDICYTFGGVNLYVDGISSSDYMFRFVDQPLADTLVAQHTAIIKSDQTHQDYAGFTADTPLGTIYIDSGKKGDSRIYERACALATSADHILYVSQYCPNGPLITALNSTESDLYFNRPSNATFPTSLMLWWDTFRTKLPSLYTRKKYLHAKFMIFTLPGGKKVAITGSHNFSHTGVQFGTREIALETADPSIIQQLESFFDEHVS